MNKIEVIKELLSEFLQKMGVSFSKIIVQEDEQNNILQANIETEEAALVIGMQGKNLEALQHLIKSCLFKNFAEEKTFLIIDVEGFKKKKIDAILEEAKEKAEAVKETKISQNLPPLNSYLRRLIHLEFSKEKFKNIKTDSFGEEPYRKIKLSYQEI